MLTAYFDDSGTHADAEVVLWNGLFGNNFQWDHFNQLWAAKLQKPSPGKEPLKRFHMANCQAADGEFSGWKRTETDFLVHELGDIILKCGLYCDCAVISRKDWNELITGDLFTALGDAEGYSLRMAFVRASKWARQTGGSDKIAFVFDRRQEREKEGKRIYALFEHLSKDRANGGRSGIDRILQLAPDIASSSRRFSGLGVLSACARVSKIRQALCEPKAASASLEWRPDENWPRNTVGN